VTAAASHDINTAVAHLRDVLGEQTYESLARTGETMTTAPYEPPVSVSAQISTRQPAKRQLRAPQLGLDPIRNLS
jgi:hypothetical protein